MSGEKKARIAIIVDLYVFNDAIATKRMADQQALTLLRERARRADPDRVARMMRHVNRQLAEQGFPVASSE